MDEMEMKRRNWSEYEDEDEYDEAVKIPFAYECAQIVINGFAFLLTFIGNSLVVVVLFKDRRLLQPMRIYIVSICASGMICSVLILTNVGYFPSVFLPSVSCSWHKVRTFVFFTSILSSVFFMLVIAIERYQVIVLSSSVNNSFNSCSQRMLLICVVWLICCTYNAPIFFVHVFEGRVSFEDLPSLDVDVIIDGHDGMFCIPVGSLARLHFTLSAFVSYVFPVSIMTFLYRKTIVKVVERLKRLDGKSSSLTKAKLRAVKTMTFVVVIFAVCWLPGHSLQLFTAWYVSQDVTRRVDFRYVVVHDLALHWAFAHNWIHTFVYPAHSQLYRAALKKLLVAWITKLKRVRKVRDDRKLETY